MPGCFEHQIIALKLVMLLDRTIYFEMDIDQNWANLAVAYKCWDMIMNPWSMAGWLLTIKGSTTLIFMTYLVKSEILFYYYITFEINLSISTHHLESKC